MYISNHSTGAERVRHHWFKRDRVPLRQQRPRWIANGHGVDGVSVSMDSRVVHLLLHNSHRMVEQHVHHHWFKRDLVLFRPQWIVRVHGATGASVSTGHRATHSMYISNHSTGAKRVQVHWFKRDRVRQRPRWIVRGHGATGVNV